MLYVYKDFYTGGYKSMQQVIIKNSAITAMLSLRNQVVKGNKSLIRKAGNLGIGTTSPSKQLVVNGTTDKKQLDK